MPRPIARRNALPYRTVAIIEDWMRQRDALGSEKQLAERMGVSYATVRYVIDRKRHPGKYKTVM